MSFEGGSITAMETLQYVSLYHGHLFICVPLFGYAFVDEVRVVSNY